MQRAMNSNQFHSVKFFWIDAGVSRFYTKGQPDARFDLLEASDLESDRLYITGTEQLVHIESMPIDQVIGSQRNFVMGTVFGGHVTPIARVCRAIIKILFTEMLSKGRIDNEQVALGLVYKEHKDWFHVLDRNTRGCYVVCL